MHMIDRRCFVLLLATLLVTQITRAGSLAPPIGPVASTMKTLDEVAPSIPIGALRTPGDAQAVFIVDEPGRYHLTGDVIGEVGKHGIEIRESPVWLDLNGFTLHGVPGSLSGVLGGRSDIVIKNGAVQDWGDHGVSMNLIADFPTFVSGPNRIHQVCQNLIVTNNGGVGIAVDSFSTVVDCDVRSNGTVGILTGPGCRVTGCTVVDSGIYGIRLGGMSVAEYSVVRVADFGIWTPEGLSGVVVRSCGVSSCEFDGIVVPRRSVVVGCLSTSNFSDGIVAGRSCLVFDCVARDNSGIGISATQFCVIDGCTVTETEFGDAIRVDVSCLVTRCLCHNNSAGAGVLATGDFNWIDGNMCITNNWGVKVNGADNWIVRNRVEDWTVSGFDIAPAMNNKLGTIQGSPNGAGAMHNFDF